MDDAVREALLHMKDTEGWEIVESYITSRIQDHEKQLLSCSLEDVTKHREQRRSLVLLMEYIQENTMG